MFSGRQIRAARGMLDWTRDECGEAAGISPVTIRNIEKGIFQPHESTIAALIKCIRACGIEFTDNEGVRKIGKCPNCGWSDVQPESKDETGVMPDNN